MGLPVTGNGKARANDPSLTALSGGSPRTLPESVFQEVKALQEKLAQSVQPVGLIRTDDHRYYWNGDGPLPGVTDTLKVIQKWELAHWRENAIEARAYAYGQWMEPGDAIAAVDADRDHAGSLGTAVHLWAHTLGAPETALEALQLPEWAIPYLRAYQGFLGHLRGSGGEIVSAEHAVINLTEGYGGTYDLILDYQGATWLVDLKTSKGYYPEYALQLAAYGAGEFVALPNDPVQYPMPYIERYGVLHLRPDQYPDTGWRLVEYPIRDRDYVAFLAALDLYQWQKEGRFRKSILQKAIVQGDMKTEIRTDPLTTEDK